MRLIIVRHGETHANAKKIMQGHGHGRLSRKGGEQVRALAEALKPEEIDVIYTSDLRRAVNTAGAIARFHNAKIRHVKALREMRLGRYEGVSWKDFSQDLASSKPRQSFRPEGGESFADLKRRVKPFATGLHARHSNQTVLISTHGFTIRCLLSIYLGMPLDEAISTHQRNAGFVILEVGKNSARIVRDEMTLQ